MYNLAPDAQLTDGRSGFLCTFKSSVTNSFFFVECLSGCKSWGRFPCKTKQNCHLLLLLEINKIFGYVFFLKKTTTEKWEFHRFALFAFQVVHLTVNQEHATDVINKGVYYQNTISQYMTKLL